MSGDRTSHSTLGHSWTCNERSPSRATVARDGRTTQFREVANEESDTVGATNDTCRGGFQPANHGLGRPCYEELFGNRNEENDDILRPAPFFDLNPHHAKTARPPYGSDDHRRAISRRAGEKKHVAPHGLGVVAREDSDLSPALGTTIACE